MLTFDDGPWPATDRKILAALAQECVRATFFLIGKPASEHPELVRRMAAEGHTVAHHTWTHHNLKYMKPEAAIGEIDKGIAAVEMALHGTATTTPSTPFFRFPFFEMTPATLDALQTARHRRVRRRPLGQRLESDDAGTAIASFSPSGCRKRARASSCCTIPRRRPPPCCRRSCAGSATTAIAWSIWCPAVPKPCPAKHNRSRSVWLTRFCGLDHDRSPIRCRIQAIKAAFMAPNVGRCVLWNEAGVL